MKLRAALGLSATLAGLPLLFTYLPTGSVAAQPPRGFPGAEAPTKSPVQLFKEAQSFIEEGRFDIAAESLKRFLASEPTERDYLELMKFDPAVFVKLRNVAQWSDSPLAQAEAKKLIEDLIDRSEEINKKKNQDPVTVAKFVRNLGASYEERVFAEQRLRLAGDAVAPALINALRTTTDAGLRSGIASLITKLNLEQLPGILSAVEGNISNDDKLLILRSLVTREDLASQLASGDTDFAPHLWYYSSSTTEDLATLRAYATSTLEALSGGRSKLQSASQELVNLAEPYVAKQGRFRVADRLKLWLWNEEKQTVEPRDATALQLGDYLALRNLRWAIERNPNNLNAQEAFLSLTVDRAVEGSQLSDLASSDPALYQVLASTPYELLSRLSEKALSSKDTNLAFGFVAALSARGDRAAAEVNDQGKPGVLLKALDYPDPRVQLAAATGIIDAGTTNHGRHAKVVDVLRRIAAIDTNVPADREVGKALIVDPLDLRSNQLAAGLRGLGYTVERFRHGKAFAQRMQRAADADLIFIDRHVVNPTLPDLFPLLGNSIDGKPVFLVASTDTVPAVPINIMLLRLAAIIAVTETSSITVPEPFRFDPRIPVSDVENAKSQVAFTRDNALNSLYMLRLNRMKRLIEASGFNVINASFQLRLDQRLPQLTYAALAAEYPVTLESSPETYKLFISKNRVVLNNPQLDAAASDIPTDGLSQLIEELEGALNEAQAAKVDALLGRIDASSLGIEADAPRDVLLEESLKRFISGRRLDVKVIPETISPSTLASDLKSVGFTAAQAPINNARKKALAKRAVEYLRKLALNEVSGYDIRPAEEALRNALRDDDLATLAIDAVSKLPGAAPQQDLLTVALSLSRPVALRKQAAERLIRHIQVQGKQIAPNQLVDLAKLAVSEQDTELRGRLAVVRQLLSVSSNDLGKLMQSYPLPVPAAPKPPVNEAENGNKNDPERNDLNR